MTKTEVTRVVFISNDGKEFLSERSCFNHEKEVERKKKRADYLSQHCTDLLRELNPNKDRYDFIIEFRVDLTDFSIKQKSLHEFAIQEYEEPDEDFNLDYNTYRTFVDLVYIRHGFDIDVPSCYWSK